MSDRYVSPIQNTEQLQAQLNDALGALYTGKAPKGAITAAGLTMGTGKLLGRTTAATGAVEEIAPGSTLTFAAGALGLNLGATNLWTGPQTLAKPITPALTFATLPATPTAGQRSFITDCNTATFMAPAAAGGANKVPLTYDGAQWVVG